MVTNFLGFVGHIPLLPPFSPRPQIPPKKEGGEKNPKMQDLAPTPWHEWL